MRRSQIYILIAMSFTSLPTASVWAKAKAIHKPPVTTPQAGATSENLSLFVAPKLGATIPTSKLGATFLGALEVAYVIPPLYRLTGIPIGVAVEFSYLQPGLAGAGDSPAAGGYSYSLDERLLVLGVEGFVSLPLGDFMPYGGIGYGLYFLNTKVESFGSVNTESQVRSGMQIRAGLGYDIWMGQAFAEARYHYVGLQFQSTGDANAGGITFTAGFRFSFDKLLNKYHSGLSGSSTL